MPYLDPTTLITCYIEEVVNGGNLAVVDSYIAPTYVRHDPGLPFDVQGPDGVRQLVTVYRTAFPDIHFDRQALVGDRDRVAVYWLIRGTHQGILMGMSPTGKTIEISALEIFRLAGTKIAEHWAVVDYTAMFQQLGAT